MSLSASEITDLTAVEPVAAFSRRPGTLCLMCQGVFLRPSVPIDEPLRLPLQGKLRHRLSHHCDHCAILRTSRVHASDLPWFSLVSGSTTPLDWRFQKRGLRRRGFSNVVNYMAASTLNQSPALALDPAFDYHQRALISVKPNIHSGKTDDESCFEQMRQWVRLCTTEHKTCRQPANNVLPSFLPTRLIDVSGDPKLVVSAQHKNQSGSVRYTTVSHRWGQADMPKLLRSNIDELRGRICPRNLTPTFQDAITVTRQLGFHYIWIDSLCIVQDDTEDWRTEASLMGSVYRNASCNLGAVAAADKMDWPKSHLTEGLFQSRDTASLAILNIRLTRTNHDKRYWAFTENQLPQLFSRSLTRRGWVYQERILSPCSIYFDHQLIWECSELIANETFPEGVSYNSILVEPDVRLSALLPPASHYDNKIARVQLTYQTWLLLVRFYSDCQLTFRSDVFPAISGLAKCFNDVLEDDYLAGLWRGDLVRGLLWHRMGYYENNKGWRDRTQDHAPSWSWAAAQGTVQYFPLIASYPAADRDLVTIHEAQVNMATSDPMGAVNHGIIRISANIRPNDDRQALAECLLLDFTECYDEGYIEGARECEGTYFLTMTYSERGDAKVCGLIVKPTNVEPDEYERVGAFRFDPKVRPEFENFDMENLSLQTITLV